MRSVWVISRYSLLAQAPTTPIARAPSFAAAAAGASSACPLSQRGRSPMLPPMAPLTNRIRLKLRRLGVDIARYPHRNPGSHLDRDLRAVLAGTPSPVIFDVGAHEGRSVMFYRSLFPECTIHSFEPGPATFHQLVKNTAHLERVHTNQTALGSQPGAATLMENTYKDMSSILAPSPAAWGKVEQTTTVTVGTVDGYCQDAGVDRIDVLKIDTQGYDLEVLRGSIKTLDAGRVRVVVVEVNYTELYQGGATLDEIYRFATDHRFRLKAFYNTVMLGEFAGAADAMFVHKSQIRNTSGLMPEL